MARLEFNDIARRASGNWSAILPALGPFQEVVEAQGRRHVGCPMHEGTTNKNFRILKDFDETGGVACNSCGVFTTGFNLLVKYHGCSIYEAFKLVSEYLDGNPSRVRNRAPRRDHNKRQREEAHDKRIAEMLLSMHTASLPAEAPEAAPLRAYLAKRGVPMQRVPKALRFHPALPYYDQRRGSNGKTQAVHLGDFPAILASVYNPEGRVIAYHRIYLTKDGDKADVPSPKRLTPRRNAVPLTGSAIRLHPATRPVLALTEGFETGLAVMLAQRVPTWPTVSAQMLESVVIPDHVQHVAIYADLDRSTTGQLRAQALCERLQQQGKSCSFFLPPGPIPDAAKSVDWLDIYVQAGAQALPSPLPTYTSAGTSPVTVLSPRLAQAG